MEKEKHAGLTNWLKATCVQRQEIHMDAPNTQKQNQGSGEGTESLNVQLPERGQIVAPAPTPDGTTQEAERRITELLATLGHAFRTPLAAIKGYSSMLLRQEEHLSPQERRAFLQVIQEAGQHLEILTEHVLEMTNLESGAIELNKGTVDIPALVQETILGAQKQVSEHLRDRVNFHTHLRDGSGNPTTGVPPVTGDRRRLRAVLEHLLENAIRFSPEGGRIDVIMQPILPAQTAPHITVQQMLPFLEICVCDCGIGIPEEHLEHIFERFHRVDTRLTREVSGLGLGLAICQHLVALHQGRIWAESCSAGGSAFHVWLPVAEPPPMG